MHQLANLLLLLGCCLLAQLLLTAGLMLAVLLLAVLLFAVLLLAGLLPAGLLPAVLLPAVLLPGAPPAWWHVACRAAPGLQAGRQAGFGAVPALPVPRWPAPKRSRPLSLYVSPRIHPPCRHVPLTACQTARGPLPRSTLRALLPPAARPPGVLPAAAGSGKWEGGPALQEATQPKRTQRVAWWAVPAEEDRANMAERRRLVAAHPQLLLLLQHPQLHRCGTCNVCSARQANRTCLTRDRYTGDLKLQRKREQGQQQRQREAPPSQHVPLSAGVGKAEALRVAAAFKLLYPEWRPTFLTEERLAAVAASLPAAAAALQRRSGELEGSSDSSAGGGRQRRGRKHPAWHQQHMQRLLERLRDEDEDDEAAAWQQEAAASDEEEAAAEGEMSGGKLAPTQAPPSNQRRAGEVEAEEGELDGHWQQQRQQGGEGSAFRRLPSAAHASAARQRAASCAPTGQPPLQQLQQQLQGLPADVQLAFRAGLAAGLPPAAVAAALQRYHAITGFCSTSAAAVCSPQPAPAAAAAAHGAGSRKRQRRSASGASSSSDTSSGGEDIEGKGDGVEDEEGAEDEDEEGKVTLSQRRGRPPLWKRGRLG